jgi:hypothetical protein
MGILMLMKGPSNILLMSSSASNNDVYDAYFLGSRSYLSLKANRYQQVDPLTRIYPTCLYMNCLLLTSNGRQNSPIPRMTGRSVFR